MNRAIVAGLALALLAAPALAQAKKKPALTGNPVQDFQNAVNNAGSPSASNSTTALPCDFNLFANLNANNLIASVHACIQSKVEGEIIAPLMLDTQAALASAQAYNGTGDTTGINCLKPGLSILQAAAGVTPAPAAATQPASSTPATSTAPAATAAPAPSAASTTQPGPVLLFQKWREFVLAGGPAACKSWITTTITGGSLLAQ